MQTNDLADASARVEQERQEDEVAPCVGRSATDPIEHGLDLRKLQVLNLAHGRALEWNAQDALGLRQVLRLLGTQEAEETVNGTEPDIARTDRVASCALKVLQKSDDPLHRQILDVEVAGITTLAGHELKQNFDAIPVALQGVWAASPLPR
jgi:hypothetical protein